MAKDSPTFGCQRSAVKYTLTAAVSAATVACTDGLGVGVAAVEALGVRESASRRCSDRVDCPGVRSRAEGAAGTATNFWAVPAYVTAKAVPDTSAATPTPEAISRAPRPMLLGRFRSTGSSSTRAARRVGTPGRRASRSVIQGLVDVARRGWLTLSVFRFGG